MPGNTVRKPTEFGGYAGTYENIEQGGAIVEPHVAARAMRETNSADAQSAPRVGISKKAS